MSLNPRSCTCDAGMSAGNVIFFLEFHQAGRGCCLPRVGAAPLCAWEIIFFGGLSGWRMEGRGHKVAQIRACKMTFSWNFVWWGRGRKGRKGCVPRVGAGLHMGKVIFHKFILAWGGGGRIVYTGATLKVWRMPFSRRSVYDQFRQALSFW